ncbi:Uma2 family endonuclease [Streptomyces graminilatus]|uniref:Uma2 family endonuclease n=1 Tax=Streptomyces graminilatus TaxID=1464070 RepID=UPI0006E24344|nr:Uma2 family endonuclease [Streptomyces graminilatus]
MPPPDGWTAEDLDRIPGLPSHTELLDGSLVFVSPQTRFHARALRLLERALLEQAPGTLDVMSCHVMSRMTVRLDARNRPEPDVIVVRETANTGPDQTWYEPEDVLLAVEAVAADTRDRDREVKPRKYAVAGVAHFWRVEQDGDKGLPVVHVYELDPATKAYALTGIFHDRLKPAVPFDIDTDLTAIDRRPGS